MEVEVMIAAYLMLQDYLGETVPQQQEEGKVGREGPKALKWAFHTQLVLSGSAIYSSWACLFCDSPCLSIMPLLCTTVLYFFLLCLDHKIILDQRLSLGHSVSHVPSTMPGTKQGARSLCKLQGSCSPQT